MIVVIPEPEHARVRARMGGMLTLDEVAAFSREEQAAVRAMGLASGEFDLLVETEGNLVQTQEVMDAMGRLMLDSPLKARRIATVRAGVLTRMQSRRLSKLRSNAEVFETVKDAEAWLAEPSEFGLAPRAADAAAREASVALSHASAVGTPA